MADDGLTLEQLQAMGAKPATADDGLTLEQLQAMGAQPATGSLGPEPATPWGIKPGSMIPNALERVSGGGPATPEEDPEAGANWYAAGARHLLGVNPRARFELSNVPERALGAAPGAVHSLANARTFGLYGIGLRLADDINRATGTGGDNPMTRQALREMERYHEEDPTLSTITDAPAFFSGAPVTKKLAEEALPQLTRVGKLRGELGKLAETTKSVVGLGAPANAVYGGVEDVLPQVTRGGKLGKLAETVKSVVAGGGTAGLTEGVEALSEDPSSPLQALKRGATAAGTGLAMGAGVTAGAHTLGALGRAGLNTSGALSRKFIESRGKGAKVDLFSPGKGGAFANELKDVPLTDAGRGIAEARGADNIMSDLENKFPYEGEYRTPVGKYEKGVRTEGRGRIAEYNTNVRQPAENAIRDEVMDRTLAATDLQNTEGANIAARADERAAQRGQLKVERKAEIAQEAEAHAKKTMDDLDSHLSENVRKPGGHRIELANAEMAKHPGIDLYSFVKQIGRALEKPGLSEKTRAKLNQTLTELRVYRDVTGPPISPNLQSQVEAVAGAPRGRRRQITYTVPYEDINLLRQSLDRTEGYATSDLREGSTHPVRKAGNTLRTFLSGTPIGNANEFYAGAMSEHRALRKENKLDERIPKRRSVDEKKLKGDYSKGALGDLENQVAAERLGSATLTRTQREALTAKLAAERGDIARSRMERLRQVNTDAGKAVGAIRSEGDQAISKFEEAKKGEAGPRKQLGLTEAIPTEGKTDRNQLGLGLGRQGDNTTAAGRATERADYEGFVRERPEHRLNVDMPKLVQHASDIQFGLGGGHGGIIPRLSRGMMHAVLPGVIGGATKSIPYSLLAGGLTLGALNRKALQARVLYPWAEKMAGQLDPVLRNNPLFQAALGSNKVSAARKRDRDAEADADAKAKKKGKKK